MFLFAFVLFSRFAHVVKLFTSDYHPFCPRRPQELECMFFRVLFAVGSIRFHLSNGTFPHVSKPPSVVAQLTKKKNFPHHIKFDKRELLLLVVVESGGKSLVIKSHFFPSELFCYHPSSLII